MTNPGFRYIIHSPYFGVDNETFYKSLIVAKKSLLKRFVDDQYYEGKHTVSSITRNYNGNIVFQITK